ncbi:MULTISPECIES: bifunctional DNA-binding transcriptional regulator/O6-methylguanine-DNA methyltransferase Ada [Methylotenera]|uniref:bifunctional DNA-binding transcriptional regulator/O6-methylguanine-DNA methyltransferase Ada n=1 Tax=Methylotenera TaxID=359407 RepID=UPI00037578E7|nr:MULTISPECIES: bifunctional DNA-binding transcriptional regulator/O6-methylguanine-DNA methyltransferase Ada [Methylotenera]
MNQSTKIIQVETTEKDSRWAQVQTRDASVDGTFYYSVSTTGIYCKPSCGARQPRPEHVAFHDSCAEAELAGFRACKRCKPGQTNLAESQAILIAQSCRLIEAAEENISLETLAKNAGLSTYHFHRIFKSMTGLTPKAYSSAHRAKKIRSELTKNKRIKNKSTKNTSVTDAIFDAGYSSNSRFYEKSTEILGMTPSNYKAGGASATIKFAIGEFSLGKNPCTILVASSERGVCAIFLGDDAVQLLNDLQDAFPCAKLIGADRDYEALVAKVVGFIQMPAVGLTLPLDIQGTAFQQRVWQALRHIPTGVTASYSDIAKSIGSPKAVRAVASACAANTLAVAIPCHRVVRMDGSLSGYRWGVERKRALLDLETKK